MKRIFIFLVVFVLFGATGMAIYVRNRSSVRADAASIGIGSLTPTPSPAGNMAMQDVKNTIGSQSFDLTPPETPGPIQTLKGGMKIQVLKKGAGEEAKKGMTVSVLYTGTLENGTKFDSALNKESPFKFVLGSGKIIKGFDTGVLGMKVGEKRKLGIPPALAYGMEGAGSVIPPNAALYFDVELLSVESATGAR